MRPESVVIDAIHWLQHIGIPAETIEVCILNECLCNYGILNGRHVDVNKEPRYLHIVESYFHGTFSVFGKHADEFCIHHPFGVQEGDGLFNNQVLTNSEHSILHWQNLSPEELTTKLAKTGLAISTTYHAKSNEEKQKIYEGRGDKISKSLGGFPDEHEAFFAEIANKEFVCWDYANATGYAYNQAWQRLACMIREGKLSVIKGRGSRYKKKPNRYRQILVQ